MRKTTLREVRMLRTMRHENIVSLKEAFRRKQKLVCIAIIQEGTHITPELTKFLLPQKCILHSGHKNCVQKCSLSIHTKTTSMKQSMSLLSSG